MGIGENNLTNLSGHTYQKLMAVGDFSWIYLVIFLAVPLARILPRVIAKIRKGDTPFQRVQESNPSQATDENNPFQATDENNPFQTVQEKQFQPSFEEFPNRPHEEFSEPKTNKMRVLGEINRRSFTFENIQKNTRIDNKELDSILEDLEKDGMLKVLKKQGLTGVKTELHPTDKGVKEYYS